MNVFLAVLVVVVMRYEVDKRVGDRMAGDPAQQNKAQGEYDRR
jgi:hypothetical protein